MEQQIPPVIKNALDQAAKKYAESEATTNAGVVLRFFAKFIRPSTIIKLFAHKLSK